MKLSELVAHIPGNLPAALAGCEVSGMTSDSRKVVPGSVFVCIAGTAADGHDYAASALEKGAMAVVCERDLGLSCQILVPDTHAAYSRMAANWYGNQ